MQSVDLYVMIYLYVYMVLDHGDIYHVMMTNEQGPATRAFLSQLEKCQLVRNDNRVHVSECI